VTERLVEWTVFTLVFSALFVFKWCVLLVMAVVITAITVK
jgi:hypothetical protein